MNYVVLLLSVVLLPQQITSANSERSLARPKRYVAFPEGATLSIALCMTSQTILRPSELFTEGLNWGISYDLPNNSAILADFKAPGGFVRRRRSRRDLYQKMELIMDSMGYNGKDCIFKALCEAGAVFNQRGEGLFTEVLRIVFGFPTQGILNHEPNEHGFYRDAHIAGLEALDPDECSVRYSKCTFSLIDMALGFYAPKIPSF